MASSSKVVQCTPRLKSPLQRVPVQEETPKHIIENGDFRIDLLSRRVTVCGREVQLNSEEFDLLVFLAKHPRKVVTPQTQVGTRWGQHEARQTQFLRALAALRRKVEEAAGRTGYIRTEPWIFCRFDSGL